MAAESRFGMLRKVLRALGLSQQAADDAVNFIGDLLVGESKDDNAAETAPSPQFPYHLRDHFLSPAELSFYEVLRTVTGSRAVVCTKVAQDDLFYVKRDDPSRYRIYTNKIDRKHVDFLLCDPATMRPLVGIELDDKSHQRPDRQERDAFVDQVFQAAGLPLLHVPAKRAYVVTELAAQLAPFFHTLPELAPVPQTAQETPAPSNGAPVCPKCGSPMILRTTKKGDSAGNRFWGCSQYPACRSMLPYSE